MESPQEKTTQITDFTRKKYRSFQDYVAFNDDDPLWMMAYKLALRFFGIFLMIILSPFLIIGLTIAILAVL